MNITHIEQATWSIKATTATPLEELVFVHVLDANQNRPGDLMLRLLLQSPIRDEFTTTINVNVPGSWWSEGAWLPDDWRTFRGHLLTFAMWYTAVHAGEV